jgi:hypothetical protein
VIHTIYLGGESRTTGGDIGILTVPSAVSDPRAFLGSLRLNLLMIT